MSKKVNLNGLIADNKENALTLSAKEVFSNKDEDKSKIYELILANKENALSLSTANKKLNAQELEIANKELLFQNEEKEKRAAALIIANKKLADEISLGQKLMEDLRKTVLQLEMSNSNMIGRELKMIELKKEINALLLRLGEEKKYGLLI